MTHRYRANPLYPVLVLAVTGLLVYVLVRTHTRDLGGRTIPAVIFAAAAMLQAILLFIQPEFEFTFESFTYRERRLMKVSRRNTVAFTDLERVRIKGSLIRFKRTDGEVGLVKLSWLSRPARQQVLRMFRELPQYVDDPFAEARQSMSQPTE